MKIYRKFYLKTKPQMKIVHLFSIYLFSSTPYPITGYLIFKDNSLFLRSTILLSIISIEVKRGEGKRDATSWNFNQRTIRKKKKKNGGGGGSPGV